jgi:ribosomal protein S12 methylthiotransferase accessory factor
MPRLGITACVDATPHDLLGVPVWFSSRPAGLTNCVHAGKGVNPMEAQVGALMEAIEYAAAERADSHTASDHLPLRELLQAFGGRLSAADLAPRFGARLPPERVVAVDVCEDVATGAQYQMPSELLRLVPPPTDDDGALFGSSSNGLASGNSLEDATLHGLLEVLERDCLALDHVRPSTCWIAPATLPAPFSSWHARWLQQGIRLRVRRLDNEFGLSCVEAELIQLSHSGTARSTGYGIHPDATIALARAVTEAAQCRLHSLRFEPESLRGPSVAADEGPLHGNEMPFDGLPSQQVGSVDDLLSALISRLRTRGLPWVLRRRMNSDASATEFAGLHVVKVLVPGCETAVGHHVRIGRRLAQRLVQVRATADLSAQRGESEHIRDGH